MRVNGRGWSVTTCIRHQIVDSFSWFFSSEGFIGRLRTQSVWMKVVVFVEEFSRIRWRLETKVVDSQWQASFVMNGAL